MIKDNEDIVFDPKDLIVWLSKTKKVSSRIQFGQSPYEGRVCMYPLDEKGYLSRSLMDEIGAFYILYPLREP